MKKTEIRNRNNNLSGTRVKILAVDDEKSTIDALRISLESENYEVLEAYTGDGAIKKAGSVPLDLILLDIMLPDITGYEICNRLKKNPNTRSVPIIMITAYGTIEKAVEALKTGAFDYITKPFDQNELKVKIRIALQRSISRRK